LEILKAMHEHGLDLKSQAGLAALKNAVEGLSQLADKATEESPRSSEFAFSKSAVEELRQNGIPSRTAHAIGWRTWRQAHSAWDAGGVRKHES
jgi:hypothetical protein